MISSAVRIPMEAQRVMACAHHVARIDGQYVGNPVDVEVCPCTFFVALHSLMLHVDRQT